MFYEVQVEVLTETDTGRLKKIKEHYLVEAVSCTDAEAKTYGYFESSDFPNDFEVNRTTNIKTNIVLLLTNLVIVPNESTNQNDGLFSFFILICLMKFMYRCT